MKMTKKTFGEEVVAVPTEVALERAQTLGSRIRLSGSTRISSKKISQFVSVVTVAISVI